MKIKAIFTDIDDTIIVAGKEPAPKLIETIKKLKEKNILFIPITGRPFMSLEKLAQDLGLNDYVCGYNGAYAYDLKNEDLIISNKLETNKKNKIIDYLNNINLNFVVFDEDEKNIKTLDTTNEYALLEASLNKLPLIKASVEEIKKIDTFKILALSDPKEAQDYVDELNSLFSDDFQISISKPFFIEINSRDASKGRCVQTMIEHLNINAENILCFGDSMNDFDMIKNFPKTVAVGNAHPLILDTATWKTKSVGENGVSYFIDHQIFHEFE